MIIQCINCNKKFEVDSSLIPNDGRNIQCGSCNHTWFFIPNLETTSKNLVNNNIDQKTVKSKIDQKKEKLANNSENKKNTIKEKIQSEKKSIKIENFKAPVKYDDKPSVLSLNNILSYFIVSIISFIALIIVLDTFKSPLNNIYPNTEMILYNLFESIKDIILFIKDLLV